MSEPGERQLLRQARRVVLKIGTRVLTRPAGGLDSKVFARLAGEVAAVRHDQREVLIVSSGAIAAGRKLLNLGPVRLTLPEKQAVAAVGQPELMAHWSRAFHRHGLKAAQVLLTHEDLADRHRYLNSRNTLLTLLGQGIIPVINENDTVAVEEIKLGDNDKLSALVAGVVDADLLVLFSDIDGLCDHDPGAHAEAQVIPVLREITPAVAECAGPTPSPVSVGGMSSKLEAARTVQTMGIPTFIGNGKTPGLLPRLLEGKIPGTLILPSGRKLRGRQYWIAYAQKPRGEVRVDAGARRALVEGKKSLLPSGVIGVQGRFEPGDAVRVVDPKGEEFARGLVRFSASDLERIKGLKTSAIEAVLGACDYEEVIHKDDLVLVEARELSDGRETEKEFSGGPRA